VSNTTTSVPRRWLSQADAAAYVGVTDRTIREYIARGALPARKIRSGRGIRIDIADLDKLLEPIHTAGGRDVA
jgi:excisionase family DNA binding protein